MSNPMREALEAARETLQSICNADERAPRQPDDADFEFRFLECKRVAGLTLAKIDAALSAVPAPVAGEEISEQEIFALMRKHLNGRALDALTATTWKDGIDIDGPSFYAVNFARAILSRLSRLSRTEGEWRPFLPVELEDTADGTDPDWNAKAMECLAKQLGVGNDFYYPLIGAAQQLRQLLGANRTAPDPEESIRTRLDEQAVKSSGGVRTSTGKE